MGSEMCIRDRSITVRKMLARAEEQGAKAAADDHHGHIQATDRAEMFAPVKAREDYAGQAHKPTAGNAIADHISRYAAGLVEIQHADRRGYAAEVHHGQQILEPQAGVDCTEQEVGRHTGGGDRHEEVDDALTRCLLYTSPSPRDS